MTDDDGAETSRHEVRHGHRAAERGADGGLHPPATNLAVDFDGRGSTDSDGTIAAYSWNFGDAGIGTGAQTSHTYAAAGTYTVVLTVTDDTGSTDTKSAAVAVTAPTDARVGRVQPDRQQRLGLRRGRRPVDASARPAPTSVWLNGVGTMRMAASSGPSAYLNGVVGRQRGPDVARISYDKPGTGGGVYTSLVGSPDRHLGLPGQDPGHRDRHDGLPGPDRERDRDHARPRRTSPAPARARARASTCGSRPRAPEPPPPLRAKAWTTGARAGGLDGDGDRHDRCAAEPGFGGHLQLPVGLGHERAGHPAGGQASRSAPIG